MREHEIQEAVDESLEWLERNQGKYPPSEVLTSKGYSILGCLLSDHACDRARDIRRRFGKV